MRKALIAIGLVALVVGCTPSSCTGGLVISVSTADMQARTIVPDLDMDIATCQVAGVGPNGATFAEALTASDLDVSVDELAPGAWDVTAGAYNAGGIRIGYGEAQVIVVKGETDVVEIVVRPLHGDGTLEVSVSWGPGAVADPAVTGTVTPEGGGEAVELDFAVSGASASCAPVTLPAGYYDLDVWLHDGDESVWHFADSVRILAGVTTPGNLELPPGTLELTIVPELDNPVLITFGGAQATVASGTDMTVTANTDQAVDAYQWFLDGAAVPGGTSLAISIGSTLDAGPHRLDVRVTRGTVLSSAGFDFVVQ